MQAFTAGVSRVAGRPLAVDFILRPPRPSGDGRLESSMRNLFLTAAALAALAAGSAQAGVIYQNDFSSNTAGFSGAGALENAAVGTERYLGGLTQGATADLTLNTAGLTSVTLTFDLYGILSLDGSRNDSGGPDAFKVKVAGGPTLLDETFSNFTFLNQTFGPGALDPGRTGSDASLYGHLGYYWRPDFYHYVEGGDTTYHLSYTFGVSGPTTTIHFTGATTHAADDESFGIDNVSVSGAVPEPAAWSLMILGFAGMGAALRRRRIGLAA